MKINTLLAGLGLCLGTTGFANADIWTGTSDGYFANVYATDLAGVSSLAQYDIQCAAMYEKFMHFPFHVDFRVNTQGAVTAVMNYANTDTMLNGALDVRSGGYAFKADTLPQALKQAHVKSVYFSLNSAFNRSYAQLTLEGGTNQPTPTPPQPNPPLPIPTDCPDCGDKNTPTVSYQCVLATVY